LKKIQLQKLKPIPQRKSETKPIPRMNLIRKTKSQVIQQQQQRDAERKKPRYQTTMHDQILRKIRLRAKLKHSKKSGKTTVIDLSESETKPNKVYIQNNSFLKRNYFTNLNSENMNEQKPKQIQEHEKVPMQNQLNHVGVQTGFMDKTYPWKWKCPHCGHKYLRYDNRCVPCHFTNTWIWKLEEHPSIVYKDPTAKLHPQLRKLLKGNFTPAKENERQHTHQKLKQYVHRKNRENARKAKEASKEQLSLDIDTEKALYQSMCDEIDRIQPTKFIDETSMVLFRATVETYKLMKSQFEDVHLQHLCLEETK
jgi:hypothetical protein